ncbi:hypothetical protein C5167_035503 [Papaver somniferum]|uniref:Cytochrome P450 n=1 Tax=Papaver somniferum TaxID=3469 RepID=A0A4Y7KJH6_PAPSO|nr:cytochrome P450 81D11-like [Papaver somniferum]RZC72341.1 hypothetical protein C5167_035503 [Papaver somniferum]
MMQTLSLILSLAMFATSILIFIIRKWEKKNLPPSPPSNPILGHLHLLKLPLYRTLATISKKYGPIMYLRFGTKPVIVVSSPSMVEECLSKNDVIFANRPRLLIGKHLGYEYTQLIWAPYGPHWRNLRRISALEIFSSSRLKMLYSIRADEVRSMILRLSSASFDQVMNMNSVFTELTVNIMMRMTAGKRYYGNVDQEEESELSQEAKRFREILNEALTLSTAASLGDYFVTLKWIGFYNKVEKQMVRLKERGDEFMQELIEQRRRLLAKTTDDADKIMNREGMTMIDVLLSLQRKDPDCYSDHMIRGLIGVLISAGTDTTAGTMEWALSLLLNNPQVLNKAKAEIDIHVGRQRLVDETDLNNLPYLHAIILETLRMYPAGPLLTPHESSDDCTVGGYNIPGGTMLFVNVWAIQNDPTTWEEPNKFKPERFLFTEGIREGYKLMPFGAGRRACPGDALAMRVIGSALGSLIQSLEWERIHADELVDMTEGTGLTLNKAHPLEAKCKPRPDMLHIISQS